jgi:myo-inositol-1-phosphate synthase
VNDIEFSAAFDVNDAKVGRDLAEAVFAAPNNTYKFSDVPRTGVTVHRGPTLDGLGKYLTDLVPESSARPVDVAKVLRETRTDVVISYLPVGSEKATQYYAEQVLKAGCGFINCVPNKHAARARRDVQGYRSQKAYFPGLIR